VGTILPVRLIFIRFSPEAAAIAQNCRIPGLVDAIADDRAAGQRCDAVGELANGPQRARSGSKTIGQYFADGSLAVEQFERGVAATLRNASSDKARVE
jgi:hypothetical protein